MLEESILNYYKKYYKDSLGLPNWKELSELRITEELGEGKKLSLLEEKIGKIRNKVLLNVGCGTGGFNISANKYGAITHGIDTDEDAINICKKKASQNNISADNFKLGMAENIPFEDNTFDIVYCFTVLEHVNNVRKSLLEMIRVTKPGGKIYVNSPNYWRLYEGHYKIFWCPLFLIRPIGKFYLYLRKRPVKFLSTLNFLNNFTVDNLLKNEAVKIIHFKQKNKMGSGALEIISYRFKYRDCYS